MTWLCDGVEALKAAAADGDLREVHRLLRDGVKASDVDERGRTALHVAAENGRVSVVETLLSQGADANAVDKDGWSVLMMGAMSGRYEVVAKLLAHKVDVDAVNKKGCTALHVAAWSGYKAIVKVLISYNVDVNAKTKDRWTALHWAAQRGHARVTALLLSGGANPNAVTRDGRTALHWAAASDRQEVVMELLSGGVDADIEDLGGNTPLHVACRYHRLLSVVHLLDRHCDIHRTNKAGETPLTKCLQWKADTDDFKTVLDIAYLLMSRGAVYEDLDRDSRDKLYSKAAILNACVKHWSAEQRVGKLHLTRLPAEAVDRGPTAVLTYLREIRATNDLDLVIRHKVCVVGSSKAGKTSLVKSITSKNTTLVDEDDRTIGVDLFNMHFAQAVKGSSKDSRTHLISLWDFAGQDKYHVAHALFFSRRTLYVLCVDVKALNQAVEDSKLQDDEDAAEALVDAFVRENVWRWFRLIFTRQPDADFTIIATKADAVGPDGATRLEELQARLFKILEEYRTGFMKGMQEEVIVLRATGGRTETEERAAHLEYLQGRLEQSLPKTWTPVNILDQNSLLLARYAVKKAVLTSGRGFLMPDKYSRVLAKIKEMRASKGAQATRDRIRQVIVPYSTLQDELTKSIEDLVEDESKTILETLHDIGDVLWYSRDGLAVLGDTIILDPEFLIGFVRQIMCHDSVMAPKSIPPDQYEQFLVDMRSHGKVAHELLCALPLWKQLNYPDQMLQFKRLLQHFQLAYPVDSVTMQADSDLIVPAYWRVRENENEQGEFESLAAKIEGCDPATVTQFHWEYDFHFEMIESLFEQLAVCSYRVFPSREAHHRSVESIPNNDFAVRIALSSHGYGNQMRQVIRLEVAANNREVASDLLRSLHVATEDVLRAYPGLCVTRSAVHRGRRHRIVEEVTRLETAIPAVQEVLLHQLSWLPEDVANWFLRKPNDVLTAETKAPTQNQRQRRNSISNNLREVLEQTQALDEKLTNLHAGAGNHRDLPALWVAEYVRKPKPRLIVWILSEVSGRCFHKPIEIEVTSKFLAKYGDVLQVGLVVLVNVIFDGVLPGLVIVKKTITGAIPVLIRNSDQGTRVHTIIEEMELQEGVSANIVDDQKLPPAESYALLVRLLKEYDDFFDVNSAPSITKLECATLPNGAYQWAHREEHQANKTQLRIDYTSAKVAQNPLRDSMLATPTANNGPKFYLCNFVIAGLEKNHDWLSLYCVWELFNVQKQPPELGDKSTDVESGETIKNPNREPEKQSLWLQSFPLTSVRSLKQLMDCELRVTLKRPSRLPLRSDRVLGSGSIKLRNFLTPLISQPVKPCWLEIPMAGQDETVVRCELVPFTTDNRPGMEEDIRKTLINASNAAKSTQSRGTTFLSCLDGEASVFTATEDITDEITYSNH
ncbi:hypothetical protein Poli38472_004506 [Pythium oligandrum]|uniref:Non-specific serine/threonine protein kinase n=1 Tax=Pythium oligandrum TaxID=41045 RepID=A0A8K1CA90_PYTOL|nr:hypothetical protein Poli38472_004506 [Pythium oligandrum]|eukprot:TMW59437.1 hypothetical protein Poli38472_004506 [Pythium oligandrum]